MLAKNRFGLPMDSRLCIDSFKENILQPLRERHEVKVFFCTYEGEALQAWIDEIEPEHVTVLDPKEHTQISCFTRGLQDIYERGESFNSIIATRFDLRYLKSAADWKFQFSPDKVGFCWREYAMYWRDHRRVGDAIHIVGSNGGQAFYNALQCLGLLNRWDLHLLYYVLSTTHADIDFIDQGFWDSNTIFSNKEAFNPLYEFCDRPRIPGNPPYYGKMFQEIKAP